MVNPHVCNENWVVVYFYHNNIIAGTLERQIVYFVNQIYFVEGVLGLEVSFENFLVIFHAWAERDSQGVLTGFDIRQRKKPNHARVLGWKLADANIGKTSHYIVLACCRVDVDGVAHLPA